ncbi:hypothetical protein KIH39_00145 [Telmatocola sphagniphila]|uniref:RCC1-like domain-containing protein n=1 Tax=Telmatocola sphagniphila TaxID=1123043 RepID=A0A8E6EV76_9BACT|nr:RCC1 domain-containing protein [Telmatocola sphagniphila]QVL32365.1 hypothetical protein KIH39_00145 [Telmatocola sphagniphila]
MPLFISYSRYFLLSQMIKNHQIAIISCPFRIPSITLSSHINFDRNFNMPRILFAWTLTLILLPTSAQAQYVASWGDDTEGQLGNGSIGTNSGYPAIVPGLPSGATGIATGSSHCLALINGQVYAWGYNLYGQLGIGSNATNVTTPTAITSLATGVTAIAAGDSFSLAIQNGKVYSWGHGNVGQLGNGGTNSSNAPVAVSVLTSGVTAIAAGAGHALAIQNGQVYAWGSNTYGQLGDGTTTTRTTPVAIGGLNIGITSISAGNGFSLAVQNGQALAWGYNIYGQLGDGTTTNRSTPVAVSGLTTGVTAVAAGENHSLAIQNGHVYAWGSNGLGQLGNGTTNPSLTPVAVTGLSGLTITSIACGASSSYAITDTGRLFAWGYNTDGELGNGFGFSYSTPQEIFAPSGDHWAMVTGSIDGFQTLGIVSPVPEPGFILGVAALALISLLGYSNRKKSLSAT